MIDNNKYKEHFIVPLSSGKPQMEAIEMKAKEKRRTTHKIILSAAAAFLAALLLSNGICYASTGETWVEMIYNYHKVIANGNVEVDLWSDGNGGGISISAGATEDTGAGYSIYEDGRTYFVFGNDKLDISEEITDGGYYKYEYTDEDGIKHVIIVGEGEFQQTDEGEKFLSCWMEVLYTPDGMFSSVAFTGSDEAPAWYQKAAKDLKMYPSDEE